MEKKEKKTRQLTSKTIIYSIGTVISSVAAIVAAPIYTRTLTTSEFGNYELSYALIFLLCTVGFFESQTSMLRFMYGEREENSEVKNKAIYSSALVILFFVGLLFVTVPLTALITPLPFVKSAIFYGITYSLAVFYQNVARGKDRELDYSLGFSIYHLANLGIVCYLLIVKAYGSWALLVAMGCGRLFEIVYFETRMKLIKGFKFRYIDFRLIRKMFHFAGPLALSAIGNWVLNYYTNIQIVNHLGSDSNGIYSMSINISRSIPSVTYGLLIAWQEIAFSFKGNAIEKKAFFSGALDNILSLLLLIYILFLSLATLVMPYYLDSSFDTVLTVLYLTTGCMMFETMSNMLASIFGNNINSKPIMYSVAIGALIDIIILVPFIKNFGIIGAGYSSLIGFGVTCIIRVIWIMKSEKLKLNFVKISTYIILAIIGGYIGKSRNTIMLIIAAIISGLMLFKELTKKKKNNA
jgi:O-antigen/teichoic acid export membrane protein